MARREHSGDAVRITTAPQSREHDIATRQRRYLWSMALRTACVAGAVLVGGGWPMWVLLVGAVFLPYVAVVMANAASGRDESAGLVEGPGNRRRLGPGTGEQSSRLNV